MTLIGWICGFELGGKGGDDEATECGIELVRSCAKELLVGTLKVLVCGFAVLDVTILPICEAFRIGHFRFAERDSLREKADSLFAALGKRTGIRVCDSISVRATIAGSHDDTFFA